MDSINKFNCVFLTVILITTKRGKSGKAKVELKANWGFNDFAMEYRPAIGGQRSSSS